MVNPDDFGDPLTFHQVPQWESESALLAKCVFTYDSGYKLLLLQ